MEYWLKFPKWVLAITVVSGYLSTPFGERNTHLFQSMRSQEMRIAIVHVVLVKETGGSAEIQVRRSSKRVNHILRLA